MLAGNMMRDLLTAADKSLRRNATHLPSLCGGGIVNRRSCSTPSLTSARIRTVAWASDDELWKRGLRQWLRRKMASRLGDKGKGAAWERAERERRRVKAYATRRTLKQIDILMVAVKRSCWLLENCTMPALSSEEGNWGMRRRRKREQGKVVRRGGKARGWVVRVSRESSLFTVSGDGLASTSVASHRIA